MKKILITGADSYIGESFLSHSKVTKRDFIIETVDVKGDEWKNKDFSCYDVILHVAAIVHVKEKSEALYQAVNCDLVCDIAKKAKDEGVKQFVFLSTMAVYDYKVETITIKTAIRAKTPYAKSKYEAEKRLEYLRSSHFKLAILRPPFVYGKGCKGNYVPLRKLALLCPLFPKVKNQRSMMYVDNLTEFICLCIENEEDGLFFPQNAEYVCVSEMVRQIRLVHGKKTILVPGLAWFINIFRKNSKVNKVFGNLTYSREMSEYKYPYSKIDFQTTIKLTEG